MKLNLDIPIDCYDNINQGNMGYRGEEVYINNIRKNCQGTVFFFLIIVSLMIKISPKQVRKY